MDWLVSIAEQILSSSKFQLEKYLSNNKSLIIESVQNVNPPDIMGHQIKAYSLKLAFSKEYVEKIEKLYPGLNIGKVKFQWGTL